MVQQDTLQRFMFEDGSVRGEIVRLRASYQAVVSARHDYPLVIKRLLGETLVASVLMGATIKYQGSLIVQLQGNGPVNFIVAQSNDHFHIRGLAKWTGKLNARRFDRLVGAGHLTITIEPNEGQRYQGIVALDEKGIGHSLEQYFAQSEQLPTCLFLTANKTAAAGILLQQVPGVETANPDFWDQIVCLARTLTEKELLSLPTEKILTRLFHEILMEQNIKLFETDPISFRCRCSQERIETTLRALPYEEVISLVDEKNLLTVTCEFCNHSYRFDAVDVEKMFSSGIVTEGSQHSQ